MTNFSPNGINARTHGLLGWLSFQHRDYPEATLPAMERALKTSVPIKNDHTPYTSCSSTGSIARLGQYGIAAIAGTPYWKTSKLRLAAEQYGDGFALTQAYLAEGSQCMNLIGNAFTLVIIDADNQKALLSVDHFNRYPIYYAQKNGSLIFGSTAETVLAHPEISRELDPQGIYNYVYFHMVPSPDSIFKGIKKLQAGTGLELTGDKTSIRRFFLPQFEEAQPHNFTQLKNELRHNLTKSVKHAVGSETNVGAFLSGGLDSSTVTGILSERNHSDTKAFSIGFDANGYDEMEYARITAKHFNVEHFEYYVTPEDVVEALPFIAKSYDEPFGNSSALPAWFCAKLAKENGINLLLAGDGGDEIFAGNERYAKQKIFELYGKVPSFLTNGIIDPTVKKLASKHPLFGKAESYINQALTPLPDRLQSYNFLHRHLPSEIFNDDFLININPAHPLTLQQNIYHTPENAHTLNKMLYLDWQFTLADNDIRKVSHMCALAGVDVAYPMLEDVLLEFSCRIPSQQKLKGQKLRHFYKKALTNWLPDETINKDKQGFGLPFGVWMQSHKPLQELAYDNLLKLKNRHYFNSEFIEKLIDLHKTGHAAYYGELIWILTVLELWMEKQSEHPSPISA